MLGKLLKHEFRATARFMWVIYAAMLALSLGSHFALRYMDRSETYFLLRVLATVVTVLWVIALIFGTVMTVVLMIHRFYKNYLTDEGYLMFTLPVSIPSLVFSKLIVAIVWVILTIFVMMLGIGLAVMDSSFLKEAMELVRQLVQVSTAQEALHATGMMAEMAAVVILGIASSVMQFYAAMSLGYGFTGHKGLWSVVMYFAISVVFQIIGSAMLIAAPQGIWNLTNSMTPMQGFHGIMLITALSELVSGSVLYAITWLNLKKRLNLA